MTDSNPISSATRRWLPRALLAVLKCTDETTSHSTKHDKAVQVAGYVFVVRLLPPLRLGSGQACFTFKIELELLSGKKRSFGLPSPLVGEGLRERG